MDAASRLRRGDTGASTSRDRLGAYLERWLDGLIRAPLTMTNYRGTIGSHVTPAIGHVRLAELRPEHIRQWQRDMIAEGKSPDTANRARQVLRAALADAVRDEIIERNVVSLVRPLKVERRRRSPLSAPEALRFLEVVTETRLGPFFITALGLGLRFGELRGLFWSDIDDGVIHVSRQIPTSGPRELRPLKTGASGRRSLPLPAFVHDAIAHERTMQLEERLRATHWREEPDLIFRSPNGRSLDPDNVRSAFAAALSEAGLPSVHFHDLRHSTATLLLSLGVDMRTVQTILGHSAMKTTEAYTHVMPELTADAMARLDRLMRGNGAR